MPRPPRPGPSRHVERLEARMVPSHVVAAQAPPSPPAEFLSFEPNPSFASQQSTEAQLTLRRSADPVQVGSGATASIPADTLQVRVRAHDADPVGLSPGVVGAVAGQQYRPVDEVVTFLPGQATSTIAIPIIQGAPNPGSLDIAVDATPVTPGTTALATSTVVHLEARADVQIPTVVSSRLVIEGGKATGIALRFSKPMDPASAEDLAAYSVVDNSHKYTGWDYWGLVLFHKTPKDYSHNVALKSASYDPSTSTVTLTPAHRLIKGGNYLVENASVPRPKATKEGAKAAPIMPFYSTDAPHALRDTSGNLLNETGPGTGGYFSMTATAKPTGPGGTPVAG